MDKSNPRRVQRKRSKGWRMPPNTVYVGRGKGDYGKWGNPYPIDKEGPFGAVAVDAESAVGFFTAMLADPEIRKASGYPADLSPLRGKNLACFCPLDQPCHADVLLEIANR